LLADGTPLFSQIAERLVEDIIEGSLAEGDLVPSSNEMANFYRINPATAAKGINVLVDAGLLEKRRGIGMFVAPGARGQLLKERRGLFLERYVEPLVAEAHRLGIGAGEALALLEKALQNPGGVKA